MEDGQPDSGIIGGMNSYGIGAIEFCQRLIERMHGKIILADGRYKENQPAFGLLNGIESEGWPGLRDPRIEDYAGGFVSRSG